MTVLCYEVRDKATLRVPFSSFFLLLLSLHQKILSVSFKKADTSLIRDKFSLAEAGVGFGEGRSIHYNAINSVPYKGEQK